MDESTLNLQHLHELDNVVIAYLLEYPTPSSTERSKRM